MPVFTIPLHEFNPCHAPDSGEFCSTGGGSLTSADLAKQSGLVKVTDPDDRVWYVRPEAAQHVATSRVDPVRLPDIPDRYFKRDRRTTMVPLGQVETIRARPEGIANAEPLMRNAYRGQGGKRGPITLVKQRDGTYQVLDGNSTVAIARKHGWQAIPAHVLETPREIMAFHRAEAIKTANKKAKAAS
jgi:hypothetical protein